MSTNSFQNLIVWQKAMDLVEAVYRSTQHFPKDETFGLVSQARRSATSVPCNIAEGHGRKARRDFKRFIYIANGSLRELETQMLIAQRLNYLSQADCDSFCLRIGEVGRLLSGLARSLSDQDDNDPPQ